MCWPANNQGEESLALVAAPSLQILSSKVVIKMLIELRKIINRNAGHCYKDLETIKMNQSKTDNSMAEIKSNLEAMNS